MVLDFHPKSKRSPSSGISPTRVSTPTLATIGDKSVMVYIGPYNSGASKTSQPLLNEAGLLQISPACTWPGLTKKVPGGEASGEPGVYRKSEKITFCRVCPNDFVQGPLSAVFATIGLVGQDASAALVLPLFLLWAGSMVLITWIILFEYATTLSGSLPFFR